MRSDDEILRAIAKTESGGDPNAVGKSGEIGQYQFMPDTIRQLGGDPSKLKGNAAEQDALARKHLSSLRAKYGDDDNKIIAAWNAGEGGVDAAVKKGGDWQKNLPKGTNKFGAQYDTGAYVQRVNQNLSQETMPQPAQQPQEQPQAPEPQQQQAPSPIPVSVVGGPEQTLAEAYHARRKAQTMQWMMQDDAPAPAPAAEPQQPEAPKPQGGGLINAIGSGLKTLATPLTAFGKAYADALYPAHPQGRGPEDRGIAENVVGAAGRSVGAGAQAMGTGLESLVQGAGELLNPSPEEAARRAALPPEQQAVELGQHLLKGAGDLFAATPLGGAAAATGHAVQETAAAIPGATDEQLKASIAQLKAIPQDALQIAGPQAIAGRDEQVKRLEGLLMMPKDQRDAKLAEEAGQAGETAFSLLPMPLFLGIFGKAGKAFQLANEVKAARAAVIAQAAEKAAQPAAEAAHVAAPAAREAAPAAERLAMIEQDPAARQVINDIVSETKPISGGSGAVAEAAPGVERPKPEIVNDIIEDTTFDGKSKRATMGPQDNMVVARDAQGNDLGYLWYTKEPAGGFTIRKLEVKPEAQRKGVASYLEDQVSKFEGPYRGATDQTPEGAAYRAARGGKPKLEPAPEQMYRDLRDAMHGDPDLTKAALESRGYKMPELGEQEAAAVHEAMGISKDAAPAEKAAAGEALNGVAADLGVHPETGVEALPAINRLMKAIPEGDLKSIREIIAEAMKNPDNPLSSLRAAQLRGQEGRINAGTLFVISRAALGGVLGGMQGDDPQTQIRNVLLGAGIGAVASPKLARVIADNIMKPEVREALTNALTLHGEEGALRFPARGVGRKPSPNTENMGVSPAAKRVVRGINEQLEKAKMLNRAEVQTHEMTREAARHSQYGTVEKVLSLDSAKLSPDELASAGLAARNVRDAISEKVIEAGARVRLNPGDAGLEDELMTQMALLAKSSQQVTNLETAFARAENALAIESDVTAASKFDLKQFAGDVEMFKGALTDQGKVSPTQLAEMIGTLADKAAAAKLATVASKWPPALWNVYYGLNLLSSPLTHMRNFIGNTGALGMAVIDRAGGEILGPLYRVAGYKGETVALGETYHLVAGIADIVADSFRAAVPKGEGAFGIAKSAYKTGLSKFEGGGKYTEALGAAAAEKARQVGDGTLPWLVQTMSTLGEKNMRLMSSVDEFFKVLSFQGEMRSLAQRATQHLSGTDRLKAFEQLLENPTTAMYHGATEFAHENTFTKAFTPEGAFGGLGKKVEGVTQSTLLKMTLTPFYRTPMRIGEFSTVHTPILNALAPQFWSDMAAGGAKQQLAIAKIMTGTSMMFMAGWWASHGYVTGAAPTDKNLRAKLEGDGWQEFSVFLPSWVPGAGPNGKYVSYANIEPVSTIVGTMATFTQSAPDLDEMTIGNFMSAGTLAVSKNALNKQWWQGLSDFSDMLEAMYKEGNAKPAMTWLARKTAALIPGGSSSRYINNATDPYQHEPEINEWKRLADIYAQNTPGWGGRNALELVGYKPRPAAINGITGEPVMNENQWLGLVAPFRVSSLKNDIVLDKLVELGGAQLPKDLIPKYLAGSAPASQFKLEGQDEEQRAMKEGVVLSNEQRDRLGVLLTKEVKDNDGNTMHEAMAAAIRDPDFEDEKGGPDGGQAHKLANIYHDFLKEASAQLRDEFPDIDIAIMRRKLERDGRRFPKSMDWLLNEGRQELQQEAASRGVR